MIWKEGDGYKAMRIKSGNKSCLKTNEKNLELTCP